MTLNAPSQFVFLASIGDVFCSCSFFFFTIWNVSKLQGNMRVNVTIVTGSLSYILCIFNDITYIGIVQMSKELLLFCSPLLRFFSPPLFLCRVKNYTTSNLIILSVHVTRCWMATEFINLVLYVFSVWLCVHIRWLAWPSCYTTLAWVRHCFPSHYPRSGQRSLQGGNVTRRIARWTFQDGHLVSFDLNLFFPFLVCFLSFSPMLSKFWLSLSRKYSNAYL